MRITNKTPWKDRQELIKDISSFTQRNGALFKDLAPRISDLFEMSVYNDVIKFYKRKRLDIEVCNLLRDGTFKFKLSPTGLSQNFSYFKIKHDDNNFYEVHHNIKIQSSLDLHIYYTADISVTRKDGVTTDKQKNGKKHSYVKKENLISFFEVKNMNPYPEALLNFNGILLEFFPELITNKAMLNISVRKQHLTPSIVFSGVGSEYTQGMVKTLVARYQHNIIIGLFTKKGQIYNLESLNTYDA